MVEVNISQRDSEAKRNNKKKLRSNGVLGYRWHCTSKKRVRHAKAYRFFFPSVALNMISSVAILKRLL